MPSVNYDEKKARFIAYYNTNNSKLEGAARYFKDTIHSILKFNNEISNPEVISRVKECNESISKFKLKYLTDLERKGEDYNIEKHITDLIGIRVICLYEKEIDTIEELLSKEFEVIGVTNKSLKLETSENTFGYKGLHLDLKLATHRTKTAENKNYEDFQFEVQIRTNIQDAWSVLDHAIKYKKNVPTSLKRRINRLAALFEIADQEFGSLKETSDSIREEKSKDSIIDSEELNAFNCFHLANASFSDSDFVFVPEHIDNFVSEIQRLYGNVQSKPFTIGELRLSLEKNKATIDKYSDYLYKEGSYTMNPFTRIRHSLYCLDKNSFKYILFNQQRKNFDNWIKQENSQANI